MLNKTKRGLLLFAVMMLVCGFTLGCANKGAAKVEEEKPPRAPVKKIALLPIKEPLKFTLDKSQPALAFLGGLGMLIGATDTSWKSDKFTQAMRSQPIAVGNDLLASVEAELVAQGFEVVTLRDLDLGYADPSDFDYQKVKADADALVHVWIKQAGVDSPTTSATYKPRLNIRAKVLSTLDYEKLYDEDFDYGSDALKADEGNIPANPKYRWGTFGTLFEKLNEVTEALQVGAKLLGPQVAKSIRNSGI